MKVGSSKDNQLFSSLNLEKLGIEGSGAEIDPLITGLTENSYEVLNGNVFFAIPGVNYHGATFSPEATSRGAKLIITDCDGANIIKASGYSGLFCKTLNPRQILAYHSSRFYSGQPMNQVAVTGTNGKTSVCNFLRQIWENLNFRSVNIGTMGVDGSFCKNLRHTSPDPVTLRQLYQENITHVAMEASSHGLDQFRLDGVNLSAAAFTNLSRDHLDYHNSEKNYFKSKKRLFEKILPAQGKIVIDVDTIWGIKINKLAQHRGLNIVRVGKSQFADLRLLEQKFFSNGQKIKFSFQDKIEVCSLNLVGSFQVSNALVAAGLAISLGQEPSEVFSILPRLRTIPGRMELVAEKKCGAQIYVDYAHTPDALQRILTDIRPHVFGSLCLLFGAGGERDKGKRILMGKIAKKLADKVFVTDDNPRREDPSSIRAEILRGCQNATEIADRAEAIVRAVEYIGSEDVLIIAGKGHETGQIIGSDTLPFNDGEVANTAVSILDEKYYD